uniref:Uncharacterized protein n=1 Tax=Cannabis sativa TaxID=3483 RepID=A0A803QS42_CANSA
MNQGVESAKTTGGAGPEGMESTVVNVGRSSGGSEVVNAGVDSRHNHVNGGDITTDNQIKASISLHDSEGNLRHSDDGLEDVMVEYYRKLFTAEPARWNEVLECVDPTVRDDHNEELLRPIMDQEVKDVVFQMHPD